jgi:hypothetical protein
MKRLFLFLTMLATSIILYADDNYKSGYVITNQKDTLYGFVNLKANEINQRQCEFKTIEEQQPKIYLPKDISGYRFVEEGKYYVSHTIDLDGVNKEVFLEFLVKGTMNLYYYDGDIDYYFFENEEGKMQTISKKPDKIEVVKYGDNRNVKGTKRHVDNRYKGIVRYIFRDFDSITDKADKLEFNQKSMINIVEKYHNEVCTTGEPCIVFQNQHPDDKGKKIKFSVYAGMQYSNYTFNFSDHENIQFPIIGGQINFMNPRFSKSLSFQIDVSFTQLMGDYLSYTAEHDSYKTFAPSFRGGIKYTYPKNRIRPTAEFGFAYTHLFSPHVNKAILSDRYAYFGFFFAFGVDYMLNNEHALFIRFAYDGYSIYNAGNVMRVPQVKVGYTF